MTFWESHDDSNVIYTAFGGLALGGLIIFYVLLLWTRPIASHRSANKIRTYLASRAAAGQPFYSTAAAYSLQRATNSFAQFENLASESQNAYAKSFGKLSTRHQRLGRDLGYVDKLSKIAWADAQNGTFTRLLANFSRSELGVAPRHEKDADLFRSREALKHLVRDWSDDGREEREKTHQPIINALRTAVSSTQSRKGMRVLLPGCGMGRLAWDISQLGFEVTANEYSNFMTLPLRLLMDDHTQESEQYAVYPFYFSLSHNRRSEDLFRCVRVPDVIPRSSPTFRLLDVDFYSIKGGKYDFVVTLFFIDTSVDIVHCLQHIHDLLAPGGTWINLGPLLWTSGSVARMELSLEEVLELAERVGFEVQPGRRRINTEYTSNPLGMMRWVYEAEFWIARKV